MSELSGFLPSVDGDNKQGYQFLADWIAALISNGTYTTELQITPDADMTINLPAGRAWINGIYYHNTTTLKKTLTHADGVLARVDSVILRLDFTVRKITSQILQGEYSTNPAAPALTRTANTWDLKLADIRIGAGTIAISQAAITDCRMDDSACGIVHCIVDHIDTTALYAQIAADLLRFRTENEASFAAWDKQQRAACAAELASMVAAVQEVATSSTQAIQRYEAQAVDTCNALIAQLQGLISGDSVAKLVTMINATNAQVASVSATRAHLFTCTLLARAWATDATTGKLAQTVSCAGIASTVTGAPPFVLPQGNMRADEEAQEALALLAGGETIAGQVKFYCIDGAPEADLEIYFLGVEQYG
ncbi:MAG: hypothetical protein RR998_08315 [Oscillospiraceae bacterium]